MSDTSASRLLRLLSLLEHREYAGTELAARLGVTTRTVRRDVGRLRELGYAVTAVKGAGGGYRLGAGRSLPPLLLDDEQAVAVAVGLRTGAVSAVSGLEEASLRALAMVERVLPSRLRHRISTLTAAMVAMPAAPETAEVSPTLLTDISTAVRAHEALRFDYVDHHGTPSRREIEPHRLVTWGRRWYLVGWDLTRADWRTFRVDRMRPRTPNGPRFTPRPPPDGDVTAYLRRTIGHDMWPGRARPTRAAGPAGARQPEAQPASRATAAATRSSVAVNATRTCRPADGP